MMNKAVIEKLFIEARGSRERAFVFRSEHPIGAAVLTKDGAIFGGCNIESIISGMGLCAEQAALNNAIVNGHYQFEALMTVDEQKTFPCGVCLQYLLQFYQIDDKDIIVIASDLEGNWEESTLLTLLPKGYLSKHNQKSLKRYARN